MGSEAERARRKAKDLLMAIKPDLATAHRVGCLATWILFCWEDTPARSLKCNVERLTEYIVYLIEKSKSASYSSRSAAMWVYKRIDDLWVVWDTPDTASPEDVAKTKDEIRPIIIGARRYIRKELKNDFPDKEKEAPSKQQRQPPPKDRSSMEKSQKSVQRVIAMDNSSNASTYYANGVSYIPFTSGSMRLQKEHASSGNTSASETQTRERNAIYGEGPCGQIVKIFPSLMDCSWRQFSTESDILLNCILLRRASYASLEMRLWHLLYASTWLDSEVFRDGIRIGSLSLWHKRSLQGSTPQSYITVSTKDREQSKKQTTYDDTAATGDPRRGKATPSEHGGRKRLEIFRHKIPLQCPWNALAVLFYYKWHVLKDPPPDFEDPSWADEPLFGNHGSTNDDYLGSVCGDLYKEYVTSIFSRQSTYKHIRKPTQCYLVKEKKMDFMFQGAITTANTMYVTSNFLQRPTFETVQMRNSGFDTQDSTAPYGVLRQQYSAPSNLEHTIFPFAETIPVYDYTSDDPEEKAQRDTIAGFCNMLKMLRAVLLQDMAILFDVPFYRRMLQGNALMCSETFQRSDFMEFSEQLRNKAWDSDFLPLVNLTPKHPILARVRCCPHKWATTSRPAILETSAPTAAVLPDPNQSTLRTIHAENITAMDIGNKDQLPIEILDTPPHTPIESILLPKSALDMFDIQSISSSSYSFDAVARKHDCLPRRVSEDQPADGFAAAKKRRISEQFPNDIGSSKSNNSESTVFADGPTVPDILNNSNSTNPVTGGCLVVAGRVDPSARQKKPLGSQQAPFDIVYDEGIEKENSIGAVNGSRNIVEAALAAAMPADNWHDRSSLVGEDFGLSGINTACIRQENSQGSGNMEKEEYYSDIWNEELEESESEYDGDITAISSKNMEDIISSRDNSSNPRIHPMQKTRLPDKTSKRGMILFEYMNCVLTKDHVERQASNIITIQDDLSSIKLLMKEIVSNQYDLKAAVSSASNELASEILPQINGLHGMLEKLNSGIEDVQGLLEAIRSSK